MKQLLTLSMGLLLAVFTFAQAPQQISYQAVIRDAAGDPIANSALDLRFSVRETTAGGTIVYQEEHAVMTNDYGLVNLTVGSGTITMGTFSSIDWEGDAHFLQVEQDSGAGYVSMGASQMMSVPYALYAEEAKSQSDNTIDGDGTSTSPLEIAQQGANVDEVLTWNGTTWVPQPVIGDGNSCNTLDEAYDCNGAGAGRVIVVDSSPVQLDCVNSLGLRVNADPNFDAIQLNNVTTGNGISITPTGLGDGLYVFHHGAGDGAHIRHDGAGNGIDLFHESTGTGIEILKGIGATNHSILAENMNPNDNTTTIKAINNGTGYGLFGQLRTIVNSEAIKEGGVGGISYGLDDARVGVAGLSRGGNGVWGLTERANGTCSVPLNPLDLYAGVYGSAAPDPNISGPSGYLGVVGHTKETGSGVWGIGKNHGHGVFGLSGRGENGNPNTNVVGVWGLTQETAWPNTFNDFGLCDPCNKRMVGVLGQSKDHVAVWGESLNKIGMIANTGAKLCWVDIQAMPPIGLLAQATQANGAAGVFRQINNATVSTVVVDGKTSAPSLSAFQSESGSAILASVNYSSNSSPAIIANTIGTGSVGAFFQDGPSSSTSSAVDVVANAEGAGISVVNIGAGEGINVSIPMAGNPSPAINASTFGTGPLALFAQLNAANGVPSIMATNMGSGHVMKLDQLNPTNMSPTLVATNAGLGSSGRFESMHPANNEPTMDVFNMGVGHVGLFESAAFLNDDYAVKVISHNLGGGLHVEGDNPTTGTLASFELFSPSPAVGRVAHFDQISGASGASTESVLISTNNMDDDIPALKVTTPSPAKYAAEFNGFVDITGGIVVDGPAELNDGAVITGDLDVAGTVSAMVITAGVKMFTIDHPLDPENKTLHHACIESDEILNLYSGNVVLDENGEATIELPAWFEALNTDARYQLTCVGSFANVFIKEKLSGNRFAIGGGYEGLEVSWQLTAVRHDKFVMDNPLQVEKEKTSTR